MVILAWPSIRVTGQLPVFSHDYLRGIGRRRPAPAKRLKVAARSGISLGIEADARKRAHHVHHWVGLFVQRTKAALARHVRANAARVPSLPLQPERVAGPRTGIPAPSGTASRPRAQPGVNSGFSKRRFKVDTDFFSRLVGHSSHTLFEGRVGRGSPFRRARRAPATISGVVGHPGK